MWPRMASSIFIAAIAVACTDNPSIDGSKVAASAATCDGVCKRLVDLCGYAPEGDDCTLPDGGGYCDTQLTDDLDCFAKASSCEDAWNCAGASTDDASLE